MRLLLLIASLFLWMALQVAGSGLASAETARGRASLLLSEREGNSFNNLRLIARHSGMIFSGTALRVEHLPAASIGAVASTRITFRVQTAIRGVRAGQVIAIREWDGLWNSGERYRPGERVLLFLFPKSRLGLTSPVGGRLGRHRVDSAERVEMPIGIGEGSQRLKLVQLKTVVSQIRRAVADQSDGAGE